MTYILLFDIIVCMKNKMIKSPAELQKHVDYIIQLSDIIDYSENRAKKEEENHLDVDLILSEPLHVPKKHKTHAEQHRVHKAKHVEHIEMEQYPVMSHLAMPRRERLIVHGEFYENRKKPAVIDIIFMLFKPFSFNR